MALALGESNPYELAESMPWWLFEAWQIYYCLEPWDVNKWAHGADWKEYEKNRPKLESEKWAELNKDLQRFLKSGN